MQKILLNSENKLRNGWWIAIFIFFVALTRFIYKPMKEAVLSLDVDEIWLEPQSPLLILLVTWLCLKLRKETLTEVGFAINQRWLYQLSAGLLLGVLMIFTIAGIIWSLGGVTFELNANRSMQAVMLGLYIFFFAAMLEELLMRGFIFQRLIAGIGFWQAQLCFAVIFAVGHWENPGMSGTTQLIASLDLALGAMVFGMAYWRTKSLALPIGLHLGWNWAQGNLLGFSVSGYEHAGWLVPNLQDRALWLTGGSFGPEASVFALLIDATMLVILWKWRGNTPSAVKPLTPATPL